MERRSFATVGEGFKYTNAACPATTNGKGQGKKLLLLMQRELTLESSGPDAHAI